MPRFVLPALISLTSLIVSPLPAPAAANQTLLVPAGTPVPVHLVAAVSSGSAKAGDTFAIQATADVVVGEMIVIKTGAGGEGHVTASTTAGGNGHSGGLGLVFDYVYSADGGRIKLSDTTQKEVEDDRKGAKSTATIIGIATLGFGGLFGHNLAHGKQKTVDDKTPFTAFVADTVHVATSEHAASASSARYDK